MYVNCRRKAAAAAVNRLRGRAVPDKAAEIGRARAWSCRALKAVIRSLCFIVVSVAVIGGF